MKKNLTILVSLFCFVTSGAEAVNRKPGKTKVVYDFPHGNMLVYGLFKPTNGEKKSGLQAELEARKDGVQTAADHLDESCKGTGRQIATDWRGSFRSLGSSIFPKGILEIELNAPLRSIFSALKSPSVTFPKTPDDDEVIFEIPELPAQATKCLAVQIAADANTKIYAIPVNLTHSDSKYRIVTLSLKKDGSLQPATPADAALLQKSNFSKVATEKNKGTVEAPVMIAIRTHGSKAEE